MAPDQINSLDARPLVTIVTAMRDLGRKVRETEPDHEVVALGRRAHAALQWMEADENQDIQAAQSWLDIVYDE